MNQSHFLQSRVISALRFPLIVLVLYMHSTGFPALHTVSVDLGSADGWDIYNLARLVLGYALGEGAVPAFFLISGFLFFWNVERLDRSTYVSKLRRRIRTLLLPYLLWNLIYIMLLLIPMIWESVRQGCISVQLERFSAENSFFSLFWSGPKGYPANVPLWFVRDLMVMGLASPVVWLLARKLRWIFPLLIAVLWLQKTWVGMLGLQPASLCFFSLGAWMGIRKMDLAECFGKRNTLWFALAALLFCANILQLVLKLHWSIVNALFIPAWVGAMFCLAVLWVKSGKWKIPQILSASVFFIYCAHDLTIVSFYDVAMHHLLRSASPWWLLLLFLTAPAVKIALCMVFRWLLANALPRFSKILNGGR